MFFTLRDKPGSTHVVCWLCGDEVGKSLLNGKVEKAKALKGDAAPSAQAARY